jgi:hypothetical protein
VDTSGLRSGYSGAPPNAPWVELPREAEPTGCVAVYYSDRTSPLAAREVTRPGDNKSDPNFETGTFGLFSTCERDTQSGIRSRGVTRLFFLSSHGGKERALTGYYSLGWWAFGRLGGRTPDICLAAEFMRFIEKPILVSKLPGTSRAALGTRFRTTKFVDAEVTNELVQLLETLPDATSAYLVEVDRLERFNQYHTGHRCWNRTEPFSWSGAEGLTALDPPQKTTRTIANSSPTGRWRCRECNGEVTNRSRLKVCPGCQSVGTLEPEEDVNGSTHLHFIPA